MSSIEAQHEDGVLRQMQPLRLELGERVHIIIRCRSDASRWDLKRLANGSDEDLELAAAGLDEWTQGLQDESAA